MKQIESKARELSRDFLENEKQYRLGFVEAEQSNPKTKGLGEITAKDTEAGVRMLLSVDADLVGLFEKTLFSECFDRFFSVVYETLKNKKRVFISGCGASGRLSMRLETSFRQAVKTCAEQDPAMLSYEESVLEIMTGGDYAIIRSVESFEDYTELGCAQARDMKVESGDLLIGVTATGETTSILGTAKQALASGAKVWMVICSDPESIIGKLARVDAVFTHENCESLYMKCGGMALTGSTRMQSSTIEQAIIGAALELSLDALLGQKESVQEKKIALARGFAQCIAMLSTEKNVKAAVRQIETEAALYENGGHVTYFADEYLLDILADTTERTPTFTTPPFRPQKNKNAPLSWAFVKNPFLNTVSAWRSCFERTPRCLSRSAAEYQALGIKEADIQRIPPISLDALYEFEIGNEPDPEREGENTLSTWVGYGEDAPKEYFERAKRFAAASVWTVGDTELLTVRTRMKLFEHLAMKMMLNSVSTLTMAKLGRIRGNYMAHLNISNKKLVDRATRMIADLCDVDYETANYELFYSKLLLEKLGKTTSTTVETIDRLGQKHE